MTYPGENAQWYVKIRVDAGNDPASNDVTIRYGNDGWIADVGRVGEDGAVSKAIAIVSQHNEAILMTSKVVKMAGNST